MAEPNPKRAKMDNPGTSASSRPEELEIEAKGKLINTGTQDFDVIRNMRGFVDHTHFIESFLLAKEPRFGIFAPRRFGKSSHLNMVKKFLQIDVDPITGGASSTVKDLAKGRENYKLFDGTRIITDDRHKKLVEDHLGKHPVIHLDFKNASIDSIEVACKHCRKVVHEAFREHPYLLTSTKLEPRDESLNASCQVFFKNWCDIEQYKNQDLEGCLNNLSQFLYNHFDGAKVYILADEFDAVNASALCQVHGNREDKRLELIQVDNILADLIGEVTKSHINHVAGALITGVSSYLSGLGYLHMLNNFTVLRFLDGTNVLPGNKGFVPFYGATSEEVRSLIQKLVRNKELVKFEGKKEFLNDTNELDVDEIVRDVQSRYNGYFDVNGTRIFCLGSVLQYLQSGVASNYWKQTDGVRGLYRILKCEQVASEICKLIKLELSHINHIDRISIDDLVNVHDFMLKEDVDEPNVNVIFNFLRDQGFLNYPEKGRRGKFKLPNAEIGAVLSDMIEEILNFWKISTTSLTRLINDVSLSLMKDEKFLQDKMLEFYKAMPAILRTIQLMRRSNLNETVFSFALFTALSCAHSFEIQFNSPIKVEDGTTVSLCRPDFLLYHKDDKKCAILFELKYKRQSMNDVETTSLYALQEARGKVTKKSCYTKNYMDTLKDLERETLVIGLSLTTDLKISCSYAFGMEGNIFFLSETEGNLYADFYKEHNATSLLHNPTSLLPKKKRKRGRK